MGIYIGVSSAWKELTAIALGVSAAWKDISTMHIGAGSNWKKIFPENPIPANMIAFFAGDAPSPWVVQSGSVFPLGGDSEGESDLYSDTHTHATVTNVVGTSTQEQAQNASDYHTVLNYHSTSHNNDHSHDATDHKPLYQEWKGAAATGAVEIPTSAILFWCGGSTLPTGWARATFTEGRFVRMSASGTGGTGGNANHSHTHPNTAAASASVQRQQNYFSYPYHQVNASHSHTIPAHTSADHEPLWVALDMISPSGAAATVIPANVVAFFIGSSVPHGWEAYTVATGRLVRVYQVGTVTPGTTGGSSSHSHVMSAVTGGGYTGSSLKRGADGTYAARYPHYHSNTHTHAAVDNNWMPLSRQLLICKKL